MTHICHCQQEIPTFFCHFIKAEKCEMYDIYERLRDINGLTDYKVAKDLGFSRTTFVSWRAGKYTPKLDKLKKIADYFGVSVDYLMTGVDEETLQMVAIEQKRDKIADLFLLLDEEDQRIVTNLINSLLESSKYKEKEMQTS